MRVMKMQKNVRIEFSFLVVFYVLVLGWAGVVFGKESAADKKLEVPVIKDGETQIIKRFEEQW